METSNSNINKKDLFNISNDFFANINKSIENPSYKINNTMNEKEHKLMEVNIDDTIDKNYFDNLNSNELNDESKNNNHNQYNNDENRNFYLDNEEESYGNYDNFENSENQESIENDLTEELFAQQKQKIKLIKERNALINLNNQNNFKMLNLNNINAIKTINFPNKDSTEIEKKEEPRKKKISHQRKIFNGNFLTLTLEDYLFFETCNFSYIKNGSREDRYPIFTSSIWKGLSEPLKLTEFRKLAIRTINEVNYNTNFIEIKVDFSLEGNSELWISTRCFVNKDVNESCYFDISSINNESNIVFNKYSSLIKVIKDKYNKCFVTFGTFYENGSQENQIEYKTFNKRQLVGYENQNNCFYLENDICEICMSIIDFGNEIIEAKINVNKNDKCNYVVGNFYLPLIKRSKILICGVGQSVKLKKLKISNLDKNGSEYQQQQRESMFTSEQKTCTCCSIF